MNAADIKEQCAALLAQTKARGLKASFIAVGVETFGEYNVRAYICIHGRSDMRAEGNDFADALEDLRRQVDEWVPDEERLASILGYSEVRQAAE